MAIIALVLAFVFAPAGLILGFIARRQVKETGEGGAGLALAAIIISIVQIVAGILALIFFVVALVVFADAVSNLPTPSPAPTF